MTTLTFILLSYLLSSSFIDFIAVFAVLTVGILHGANDLEILSKRFKGKSNHLYFKFLTLYLLIVLIGMALFFVTPAFALLFFFFERPKNHTGSSPSKFLDVQT